MNPLATKLARAIFECGDDIRPGGTDKCQRIQFMGGTYPDAERPLGGLCESSLESYLDHLLARFQTETPVKSQCTGCDDGIPVAQVGDVAFHIGAHHSQKCTATDRASETEGK